MTRILLNFNHLTAYKEQQFIGFLKHVKNSLKSLPRKKSHCSNNYLNRMASLILDLLRNTNSP